MKKIIFNDKYGLTDAVLEGRKTMTRRMMPCYIIDGDIRFEWGLDSKGKANVALYADDEFVSAIYPHYQPGEVVAVAQAYKDIAENAYFTSQCAANEESVSGMNYEKGWNNKMYVAAYYMPHQIRITDIKVERLQDISDEDCIKEGILEDCPNVQYSHPTNIGYCGQYPFGTPRAAFAALIDKVSGKGTWAKNPWVFAYGFEVVK